MNEIKTNLCITLHNLRLMNLKTHSYMHDICTVQDADLGGSGELISTTE